MLQNHREPHCRVQKTDAGARSILLSGQLQADWAANLASACAAEGTHILSGRAVRRGDGYWTARLDVEGQRVHGERNPLAWLQLTKMPKPFECSPMSLRHYGFARSPEHGGSIELRLAILHDAVGLAAVVLQWTHSVGLVPVEFRLETQGGYVYHHFWLKASEEALPKDEVCIALGRRLTHFLAA